MFLRPKEKKYKKETKGKFSGVCNNKINFGVWGIVVLEKGRITARQIETVRRIISRRIKNIGKYWICIFPSKPITKKPAEVRMGKGKGSVSYWVSLVKPGKVLYEMEGIDFKLAKKICKLISYKIPLNIKLCYKLFDL